MLVYVRPSESCIVYDPQENYNLLMFLNAILKEPYETHCWVALDVAENTVLHLAKHLHHTAEESTDSSISLINYSLAGKVFVLKTE